MSYCFFRQTRRPLVGLCLAVAMMGFNACTDSYDLDEKGNNPSWLGQSIYAELQNPSSGKLTGTFHDYLRLIDDLGYTETMQRTGSKTVFAANDSAFARFYASDNSWGVKSYEDFTLPQKKQLLYASMLDNALLTEMLSNVANGDEGVQRGLAIKHQTTTNVTDTIYHPFGSELPVNNSYWDNYKSTGIDIVKDDTRPMMIHFTNEHMVNNSITTSGENSDFEVLTGSKYSNGLTYIYKNAIKKNGADIVCTNGYLNQMEELIVPPGNLGEVIRESSDTKLFTRMMDRFCAPFYSGSLTRDYNDLATLNGWQTKDSIFVWRYFSGRSQGGDTLAVDRYGNHVSDQEILTFDPGCNQYYSTYGTSLSDIGAAFIPTDQAMVDYFVNGKGRSIINLYGSQTNDEAHLAENIDSIPKTVVAKFVNNVLKTSFVQSVPSKFETIMDEAGDPIGVTLSDLNKTSTGAYDVRIANNAVAYVLNRVIPPISYSVVSGPALLDPRFSSMNWAIQDKSLKMYFYAYLQSSTARYALFLPTNAAFDCYYLDPSSMVKNAQGNWPSTARVLHFYTVVNKATGSKTLNCSSFRYNASTNSLASPTDSSRVQVSDVSTQLQDILNYHTVVLSGGAEKLDPNRHFYKTKHGGEIYVESSAKGGKIYGGAQLDINTGETGVIQPSTIVEDPNDYRQSNGNSYVIDHVIQAPLASVYSTLKSVDDNRFSSFLDLCNAEGTSTVTTIQRWATGYSSNKVDTVYTIFKKGGIDRSMKILSTYNYTLYAPNNDAMAKAHELGLPTWEDVEAEYAEGRGDKEKVKAMIDEINRFVRYHVQDDALYADNETVASQDYQTSCVAGETSAYQRLTAGVKDGVITITDNYGDTQTVDANGSKLVNKMARDYDFGITTNNKLSINTSSFIAVHEIGSPLNYHTKTDSPSGRFDVDWNK